MELTHASSLALNRPEDRLIIALDFATADEARSFLQKLGDTACSWLKVGMQLYYAEGNAFVRELRERGYNVFLDLKLHDIPNTVAGAVKSVGSTGASLLTVHAVGGQAMMEAACEAASRLPNSPRLLAVTVLTSMDAKQLSDVGVSYTPAEQVLRLARLAWASGIRGLVCSAVEVEMLRSAFGQGAELIVPGIRPRGSAAGDQLRTASPGEAIRNGASRLVVGRPITAAASPQAAFESILAEIAKAM